MSARRPAATRTVRELVHVHHGKPAVVLGGGPSLPSQLGRCPSRGEAVYISANDHGARFVECDYIAALDNIEPKVRPLGKPLISRKLWADFRLITAPTRSTGILCAWLARLMGCAPIYICGMDCFDPHAGTYFHDPHAVSGGFSLKKQKHVEKWLDMMRKHPAEYVPMGEPLASAIDKSCRVLGPARREAILTEIRGVLVTLKAPAPQKEFLWPAGVIELPKHEAARLVMKRLAHYTPAEGLTQ